MKITLTWAEKVEDSFTLDYADRPRYLSAEICTHEYKIVTEIDGKGFDLQLLKNGYSSYRILNVAGKPYANRALAKAAATKHAQGFIKDKLEAVIDHEETIEDLKRDCRSFDEHEKRLKGQLSEAENELHTAASRIHERVTLYQHDPIDALNEFLREQQVAELRELV